jgi:hypothetical protein
MSDIVLPLFLSALAFIAALLTYRGIRRGGARFYTLEREAILRRASFSLAVSVLLFLGAVTLLLYQRQQNLTELAMVTGEEVEGVPTATATLSSLPPTETPVICRAIVRGTGGSGLNLRNEPGGEELQVLQEEEIVTLVEEEAPIQAGGTTWVKVRTTITRAEGWVSLDFLFIEKEDCLARIQG